MTRAALLPHFGDPFGLAYFLAWYRRGWWAEVDSLYIICSNVISKEVADEMEAMLEETNRWVRNIDPERGLYWQMHIEPIQHGDALAEMLKRVKEDSVVFIEDDTVIFKEGALAVQFERIESGECDIVGSPRGSCAQCIIDASEKLYGKPELHPDSFDNGCNFWPNFFFARTDILFETDLMFNAKGWKAGDRIEQLNLDITEDSFGDTFVWASIQLRAIPGIKIGYCEQFHGHPSDLEHYHQSRNVFCGFAPWVHHGSLSGWRGLLRDDAKVEGMEPGEMARRLQWFSTYIEYCRKHYPNYLPELAGEYQAGIYRVQAQYEVSAGDIGRRQMIYKHLMGAL